MITTKVEQVVVLVADDDFAVREITTNALSRIGYSCMTAQDGQQALEMIDDYEFDLLVTDLDMPRMGGLELIKILREKKPELPVVIATSHTDIQTARQALQMKVIDYITKPFESIAELQAAVRRAAEVRTQRKSADALAEEMDARLNASTNQPANKTATELSQSEWGEGHGFKLEKLIGEGGMGKVYKALQVSMDRVVALKVLNPTSAQDNDFVARFLQEARVVARLDHPNIVKGYDAGQIDGMYYIAMEFIEGGSVGNLIERGGAISEAKSLEIILQVAWALKHIAEVGLIHRDIKPDNILLTPNGVVKLTDLGIARDNQEDAPALTAEGVAIGTCAYMSPEQMLASKDMDGRSDIYSLGATLFHMLTGKLPFTTSNSVTSMVARLSASPAHVSEVNSAVSEGTSQLVKKMMAPEIDKRYQTASDLIDDLQKILQGPPA